MDYLPILSTPILPIPPRSVKAWALARAGRNAVSGGPGKVPRADAGELHAALSPFVPFLAPVDRGGFLPADLPGPALLLRDVARIDPYWACLAVWEPCTVTDAEHALAQGVGHQSVAAAKFVNALNSRPAFTERRGGE